MFVMLKLRSLEEGLKTTTDKTSNTKFTVQDKVKEGEIVIEHMSHLKHWYIFVF